MLPKPTETSQEKAAKLRSAYEAGRISRDTYERNLEALGIRPEPVPAPTPPSTDVRVEQLHNAYRAGRLSRELYERNVRSLGVEPIPAPEAPSAMLPPADPRSARVTKAFEAAFEESRLAQEVQEQDEAGVSAGFASPPAVPAPEVRAAKIREAYEAGRISQDTYERNLRALGAMEAVNPPVPPPEEEPSDEPAAMESTPLMNPPPPEPSSAPAPLSADVEARVERLTTMYQTGKMTKEIYEANLARAYEAVEPRLAQLRIAFEAGRIPKDVYDVNVRRLLDARGAS